MKNQDKYDDIFAVSDSYISETKKAPLFPTLCFYPKYVHIVYYSNRFAVKGIYDDIRWANSSLDMMHALEKSGVKLVVDGMKNYQSFDTAAVFVANHMSSLETLILPGFIQPVKKVCFVMKQELVEYPLFGALSAARDPILVGRDNPREDLLKVFDDGAERLQRGKSVVIFPQKTRRSKIDEASFNTLGIKLAKKNNVPVIPIAIVSDAWANGKIIKDFGRIHPSKTVYISFGKPIYIKGSGAEEHKQVIDFIKARFTAWNREDLINEKQ